MTTSRADNTVDLPTDRILKKMLGRIRKTDSCWLWEGAIVGGYGKVSLSGRQFGAHRVMWALANGGMDKLLRGKMVCHKCNNRSCVNPAHLYQGTALDNTADRRKDGMRGWQTNLTEKDVIQIRADIKNFELEKRQMVAAKFGCMRESIDQLLRGKSWKHLLTTADKDAILLQQKRRGPFTGKRKNANREYYEMYVESAKLLNWPIKPYEEWCLPNFNPKPTKGA